MCGRYVRRSDKQHIAEHFRATPFPADLSMPGADYNIAPTTHQPIIRQSRETGDREMILARWGLVPFFTKDLQDVKVSFVTLDGTLLITLFGTQAELRPNGNSLPGVIPFYLHTVAALRKSGP